MNKDIGVVYLGNLRAITSHKAYRNEPSNHKRQKSRCVQMTLYCRTEPVHRGSTSAASVLCERFAGADSISPHPRVTPHAVMNFPTMRNQHDNLADFVCTGYAPVRHVA